MYPALAVVEELSEGCEVLWVGGEGGMEASIVKRNNLPFEAIPAAGVHGVGLRVLLRNMLKLSQGMFAARGIIRRYKPDVMFFTGGYVGVPVAAVGRSVPKVMYVPDIEPGLAHRAISRLSDVITVTAEESCNYFRPTKKVVVTGYPTRLALRRVDKGAARRSFGLSEEPAVVMVMGGSRGAQSINNALWKNLDHLLEKAQVLHITGDLDFPRVQEVQANLRQEWAERYHPFPYLHEEIADALASADLAVSRAGASTMGEYPLFGLPSVLIPYPYAWRYQKTNASYLSSRGAAVQIADEDLEERLFSVVVGLLEDPVRLGYMSEAARKLSQPEAARSIAKELERYAPAKGTA